MTTSGEKGKEREIKGKKEKKEQVLI